MKRYSSLVLLICVILLSGCSNKVYKDNDNAKLTGTITTKDDKQYLTLDNPIVIGDDTYNKIEIDYDKDLKDDYKVTIEGTINNNSLKVDNIKDEKAYVNSYSNKVFKFTIPTDIVKLVTVKEIDNGFTIYSTNNMDNGGEVISIKVVSNSEYKKLSQNNKDIIERVNSNNDNTIIMIYPKTTEYSDKYAKEYTTIAEEINLIKKSIRFI